MKTLPAVLSLLILCSLGLSAAQDLDRNLRSGVGTITPAAVYDYCKKLASPEFAGRQSGHPGYTAAAHWAASQFKKWGLKPIGREGYLQAYPSPYSVIEKAELTVWAYEQPKAAFGPMSFTEPAKAEPKENKLQAVAAKDFLPLLFSDSGHVQAEIVFVGWGISAPDLNYDDYAGVDVKGKFVLCFRGVPDPADKRFQNHDEHRTRMQVAQEKGAVGLIYIYSEVNAHPNGDRRPGFLPAMISEEFADKILKEKGGSCADLKKALSSYRRPVSFPLKAKADLMVQATYFPKGIGYNIAGYLEGSDPQLKKECVVLGAHFDGQGQHLGLLFGGANDNASGSAVVMETGRAFAALGRKPKRSVLFVLFGGEEVGSQGASYFSEHLPPMFKKVAAMFNFDMEGEGDKAFCSYTAEPADLKKTIDQADQQVKILIGGRVMTSVGVRAGDIAPFFLKGIPVAYFMSNGPHLAYHLPGDTIYRVNPDIMAAIARVAFLSSYFFADK